MTTDEVQFHFSPREIEVIKGVMSCVTLFELALILNVSPCTLKHYSKSIRCKTGQPTTKDAVIFLIKNGYITK